MPRQVLRLEGCKLLTKNRLNKGGWRKGSSLAKIQHETFAFYARKQKLKLSPTPVLVLIEALYPQHHRGPIPDTDSVIAPCLDSLVQSGLLADDNPNVVTGVITDLQRRLKECPREYYAEITLISGFSRNLLMDLIRGAECFGEEDPYG